jgi:O-6-methylguanine DNA methyltransferase
LVATAAPTTSLIGSRTTKVYCRPDCNAGRRIKPENLMRFASAEEARTAGYRACFVCKPDAARETFHVATYESPLGTYVIAASGQGVVCVKPEDQDTPNAETWQRWGDVVEGHNEHTRQAARELEEYFAGKRHDFTVALDMRGTDFQRRAWDALLAIPYGQTRSYGQQAAMLGNPQASRAVGLANGSNPVSIIVPCHRVVGSTGRLTGYGGGLHRKEALLGLERAHR